jgi:hypothetical protein
LTESQWHGEDWEFYLGEQVTIGTIRGVIVGQSTFVSRQDEYLVSFVDDFGLPCERTFKQYEISKTLKH